MSICTRSFIPPCSSFVVVSPFISMAPWYLLWMLKDCKECFTETNLLFTANVLLVLEYFCHPCVITVPYCFNEYFIHLIVLNVSSFQEDNDNLHPKTPVYEIRVASIYSYIKWWYELRLNGQNKDWFRKYGISY